MPEFRTDIFITHFVIDQSIALVAGIPEEEGVQRVFSPVDVGRIRPLGARLDGYAETLIILTQRRSAG